MDSQATFVNVMAARIRARAQELDIAPSAIADHAGIKRTSMTYYWRGQRAYPIEAVPLIADKLSISVNALMTDGSAELGDPDMVSVEEVDLAYGLGASFADSPIDVIKHQFPRLWLERITNTAPAELTFARGRGDSMQPTIQDGDLVLIDRSQRTPREWDAMWALTVGDMAMIKRLRVRGDRVTVMSDNDRVPSEDLHHEEVRVVGRVIFIGRRV